MSPLRFTRGTREDVSLTLMHDGEETLRSNLGGLEHGEITNWTVCVVFSTQRRARAGTPKAKLWVLTPKEGVEDGATIEHYLGALQVIGPCCWAAKEFKSAKAHRAWKRLQVEGVSDAVGVVERTARQVVPQPLLPFPTDVQLAVMDYAEAQEMAPMDAAIALLRAALAR